MKRLFSLLFLVFLFHLQSLHAETLPWYDFHSKIYLSDHIVEGVLLPYEGSSRGMDRKARIHVERTFKGSLQPDQIIECSGLYLYGKYADGNPFNHRMFQDVLPIETGDRLIVFLNGAEHNPNRSDSTILWSGLYSLHENGVQYFKQFTNPGGFVGFDLPETNKVRVSPANFRIALTAGINNVDTTLARLQIKNTRAEIPWLLSLATPHPPENETDFKSFQYGFSIANLAARKLAATADYDTLIKAIGDWDGLFSLHLVQGLRTAEGRAKLLTAIGNCPAVDPKRLVLTGALPLAYFEKANVPAGIHQTDDSGNRTGPGNTYAQHSLIGFEIVSSTDVAHDAGKIAQLALNNIEDERFVMELVSGLEKIAAQEKIHLKGEWDDAVSLLAQVHKKTSSQELIFKIERLTDSVEPRQFEVLYKSQYPIHSIVRPMSSGGITWRETGKFRFLREIRSKQAIANYDAYLVMKNLDSHRVSELRVLVNPADNGSLTIPFPKLPQGRYRIFLRFKTNNRIVNDGRYFDTDL